MHVAPRSDITRLQRSPTGALPCISQHHQVQLVGKAGCTSCRVCPAPPCVAAVTVAIALASLRGRSTSAIWGKGPTPKLRRSRSLVGRASSRATWTPSSRRLRCPAVASGVRKTVAGNRGAEDWAALDVVEMGDARSSIVVAIVVPWMLGFQFDSPVRARTKGMLE